MSKRISELTENDYTNPDDLIELAVSDDLSPSGYVSRSIRVSNLVTNEGGSSPCRIFINEFINSGIENNTFKIFVSDEQLLECAIQDNFDQITSGVFHISLATSIAKGNDGKQVFLADVMFDVNGYSYSKWLASQGKMNLGTADILPLHSAELPSDGYYPVLFDIQRYDDNGLRGMNFFIKLVSPDELIGINVEVRGYIDYTVCGYKYD